ncbi:zinc-binding dehydrogenase [Streptomyces capitiformicae]|uniref:zinc-binding dehydrogenase n=1 Tax=Streptomyces capitiformicae TaxID=2014920 RepID=UPI001E3E2188|nr:zinc-binding dehydrogenase [Streptomyces capitiformicae]
MDVSPALAGGGLYVSIADEPLPAVPGATKSYVQESKKDLAELVELVDAGRLRVRVAEHHPVTAVRTAHERFEAGAWVARSSSSSDLLFWPALLAFAGLTFGDPRRPVVPAASSPAPGGCSRPGRSGSRGRGIPRCVRWG